MKTEIDQLTLRLPAGFAHRAQAIAGLLGEALSRQPAWPGGRIAQLGVGPLRVDAGHSDRAIAESIASAIVRSLRES